ncbi:MAG: hypothetical protein CVU95_15980 [Firmicutes bacterium HGW-Firmicutes-2]|jgi:hypothetical protein|nr:MAG: hypothetical protein CVU95_15980 [Firmicutes bacterium HGW-Firmicutes-2]
MYNNGGAFLALFGGFIFIFLLIGIANYVLMAIGLMKMAQNQGIENPWLAWVPVGNLYIIGKLIRTIEFGANKYEKAELILLIGFAATVVLGAIPLIGTLISLAYMVLSLMCMFKLYKMYAAESATLFLILSIVFAIIAPGIILFKIKDNTPVEVV